MCCVPSTVALGAGLHLGVYSVNKWAHQPVSHRKKFTQTGGFILLFSAVLASFIEGAAASLSLAKFNRSPPVVRIP